MFLSVLFPIVMVVFSHTIGTSDVDVNGVRTHNEGVLKTQDKKVDVENGNEGVDKKTAEKKEAKIDSGSSSVVVSEGDSSVSISIHNTSQSTQTTQSESSGDSSDLSPYIYPGSSTTSQSGDSIQLLTQDSAETVTSWYESIIRNRGMNTQSFVRTNTNGRILNKMGAAGNGENILIEISAHNDSTQTHITVSRQ